jgi:type II restriction enzyme
VLNLSNYEEKAKSAVKYFWRSRENAKLKQKALGKEDQGERSSVTAGKNMDGFLNLLEDIVISNGLNDATIYRSGRSNLTLPGFFRSTKMWDFLVIYKGELVASIELKSQVGPSFGNNFNNRTEEAIGMALDFWTAYRENVFGDQPRPFVGWLMLIEDDKKSRSPITDKSPHYPILIDFKEASYQKRYDLLCKKLVQEQLYTTASIIASPKSAIHSGKYIELSEMTSLKTFIVNFAGHIASVAARDM